MGKSTQVLSVQWSNSAAPAAWDAHVRDAGGSFFHCHAHTMYRADLLNAQPIFANFMRDRECVGIAAGSLSTSRFWPFSRMCKMAAFSSLPAMSEDTPEAHRAAVELLDQCLARSGIYRVSYASYDSPHSLAVLPALGYEVHERSEFRVDLSPNLDNIWRSFGGSKRTDIRKAEKRGVQTHIEGPDGLANVYEMHNRSMQRRRVSTKDAQHHAEMARKHLMDTGHAVVLVSFLENTPISAALFGRFENVSYYLTSGSSSQGYKTSAPVHLLWTAIQVFKEMGCRVLNLGGAREDEEGLYKFKKAFGCTIVREPAGSKMIFRTGAVLASLRSALSRFTR